MTEYLIVNRNNRNYGPKQHIELEGHDFRRLLQFKYLGSIITADNDIKIELSSIIEIVNKGYGL